MSTPSLQVTGLPGHHLATREQDYIICIQSSPWQQFHARFFICFLNFDNDLVLLLQLGKILFSKSSLTLSPPMGMKPLLNMKRECPRTCCGDAHPEIRT